ncbi:MAG TPA: FHA domain-containing protein [bacterium]|nr:FHA domain-containing protein [bacterium]
MVHASGKVMGAIGKRAEHIPWLKVATEAEATLLKGQGKLAISQGGRAAVWTTHRLMNASAFTLGGMINQNLGFIEKDNAPLGLVFLQNLAMDFQMMAAHKGVNALTGGRMDKLDRKLDQELYLAPTLAKLKIPPKSAAGKAMSGFLLHYSDAMAGKRGKPLSGDELMKEVSALNESVTPLLKKNGLSQGDAFEAARTQLFIHAAKKNLSADHMTWYSERLKIPAEMDKAASDLLPGKGYSKEVRDSMKGELLIWAMDRAGHPDNVHDNLKKLTDLSGEMGKNLDRAVEGLMGPGALETPQGMRLRELLLGRALGAAEAPSDAARLLEGMAKQAPSLGKAMGELVSGLDPKARIAAVEWATEKGFDVAAFNHLRNEVKEGKVELKFEDGKLVAARVPEDKQAAQKLKYEADLAGDKVRQRGEDAAKLADGLGFEGGLHSKNDRDRFFELVQSAAKESKISMGQAKELFRALEPVLKREVDPMHLEGVRRAVFLEILGGKMGETRAWDLATQLAKGEIILEVGAFGEFTTHPRPASGDSEVTQVRKPKSADDSNADTVVELRKPKPKPTVDTGDATAVRSPTGRKKAGKPEVGDNADTVVELRDRKPAPVDAGKVGVADFKPINEIEAKADKIAKAEPSPERIQRYEKYLIEKKNRDPAEAKIQAEAWAKQVIVDARAHQAGRTHIYDTSLPMRPETAHMDAATVDHHGRFANPKNSTEQLLDKMDGVLALVKDDPKALEAAAKDEAAMASARRGFKEAGVVSPSDRQVREVAAALREMNLKEVTTDNLADGGWSVWIAKNQARVLADPSLRKLVLEATHFEDFTAFGTTYNPKDPGVRLQAALFQKYGEILKNNGIVGSDRFTPAQADKVMREALSAIDQMVADPAARKAAATEFFEKVEQGKKIAAEQALMAEASVHQGDTQLSFFDLTKLGDFTVFQQWLALPRVSPGGKDDTIQVSVVPMKPMEAVVDGKALKAERKLQIVAIPNGRELPSKKGLLSAVDAVNQAELAKAESLGLVPREGEAPKEGQLPRDHFAKLWFGKDNVILPNPMKGGSLLSPREVSEILTDRTESPAKLDLFTQAEASGSGSGANTVVNFKSKKPQTKPSGDSDPKAGGGGKPVVKAAAHSGGGGPKTEKLSPDSVPQYEAYWDPRVRMYDEQMVGKIHEYYGSDGVRSDLTEMAKRHDSWGESAKKFQGELAAFEKASREYFTAEKKFKSRTEADADPALYQQFRALAKMAEDLENHPYHKLEASHTEMMRSLGGELWHLENALAKIQFEDLGHQFAQGKTEPSFDFQMSFTSLDKLATYDGRWKGRATQDLVKAEVKVDSWAKAEEVLSGLRQSKVKVVRDGKESTEYALELTGDIAKSPDGRKGRVAVTVKGPPSHNLEIHFELKAAQTKPGSAEPQVAMAAGAGDSIVIRTVPVEPGFEGRSGHDLSGFRAGLGTDYYETIHSADARMNGGLLVPQAPNDPAPTTGMVWKVKAVQGEYVQLESGTSFKGGKSSAVEGLLVVKMGSHSRYSPGDEVRFIPPVAGGSGEPSRRLEIRPPENSDEFIIGRDPSTSHVVLGDTAVSRQHATIARNAEGQWFILDGTRNDQGERKLSQNGVQIWNGQAEVPVGREHWYPLADGQSIKIGEQWIVFRAPQAAVPMAAPNHVEAPQPLPIGWDHVSTGLARHEFGVDQIPADVNHFDVFCGDAGKMNSQSGPSLVLSGSLAGALVPEHQGRFYRDTDGGWRYMPNTPQQVYDRNALPKQPLADGSYKVEAGDIFTFGYQFYELSNGRIVPRQDGSLQAVAEMSLHLPWTAARGGNDALTYPTRGPLVDPRILSGSVDFNQPIPIQSSPATALNGEVARVTTQGVGYKSTNEDVVFSARGPDGKLLMLNVDGIGGYAGGDAAAILVAEAFKAEYQRSGDTAKAWQVANQAVLRFNGATVQQKLPRAEAMNEARKIIADPSQFGMDPIAQGSGAVAVMVEQQPSVNGQPGSARFEWVGDARAMQVRADNSGRLRWIYRTVDEGVPGMPGMVQPGVDFKAGGGNKTLVFQLHPQSHVVTNSLGSKATVEVKGTRHGETPDPNDPNGASPVGDYYANGIPLLPKDWVILGSDGFWENFGRTETILNIMSKAGSADEATRMLTEEAHWRMGILAEAKKTIEPDSGDRMRFERPGGHFYIDHSGRWRQAQYLEIDRSGRVYEVGSDQAIDHYKNDNFSLTVYQHNPNPDAASKDLVPPPMDGRSGHDQGGGQGLYGGSSTEMKLIGSGDGSPKDLQELKQAYTEKDSSLLKKIQSHGNVEGTARTYEAQEFPELLHLVMERGQPIEILPSAKDIRATVENEMYGFVVEVERRFPQEFQKAGKNDPETGESFQIKGNDGKLKANIPAMYRFAKRLLNSKLGLPVHGEASPKQKETVLGFMQSAMGRKDLDTYEKASEALRQEFRTFGPEFRKAYKAAKPAMREALLDAFFDGKRFATFTSLKEASGLLRFLGKTGHHVEFTLTADTSKQPNEYLLSIGDLTAAINPKPGLVTIIHSHPTLYVNRRRNLMGHRDTLDLDSGKEVGHSASILFSPGDFDHMMFDALRLTKDGVKMDGVHEDGVYRNWVQHRFGLSEATIQVGRDGKASEMKIRYGFYKGFSGLDGSHSAVIKQLQAYAKKEFPGVKVTFEEVPTEQIEGRIP